MIRIKTDDVDIRRYTEKLNQETGAVEPVSYLRVSNPLNYNFKNHINEINTLPSETIPDQTMGLREILVRYSRGLPVSGASVYYDGEGDEDIPAEMAVDFKNLDLAEREELARQAADNAKALRSTLQKTVEDAKSKKAEQFKPKSQSDTVDKKDEKPDQGSKDEEPKSKS